jgi:hypothetical protein
MSPFQDVPMLLKPPHLAAETTTRLISTYGAACIIPRDGRAARRSSGNMSHSEVSAENFVHSSGFLDFESRMTVEHIRHPFVPSEIVLKPQIQNLLMCVEPHNSLSALQGSVGNK